MPYSVDEIYGIRDSGKYGTLKRTYNEFYHLYQTTDFHYTVKPDKVVIEDSNSGFNFFIIFVIKAAGFVPVYKANPIFLHIS